MAKRGLSRMPQQSPIVIGCYTLTTTGLVIKGKPSFGEHEGVGDFVKRAHQASGFWLADWLRYGTSRTDWAERIDQVVDATGLSEKTLQNVRAIGAIDLSRRRDDVEFAIHGEVASLPPGEQSEWLEKVAVEGWTRRELRLEMRAARRKRVIEGQARLEGQHRVVMADYPWIYDNRPPSGSGSQEHYPGMPLDEGLALPVAAHTTPDAAMGFWVTAPLLFDCTKDSEIPNALRLIRAWGFTPKTQIIWDKSQHNFGNYVSVQHELFIICTRGSCTPDRPTPMIPSVYREKPGPDHSRKPEWFRKTLERLWDGPRLELFGREPVEGWTVFGNDSRLWAQDARLVTA